MAGWDAAGEMTDEDFSRTILRAIRLLAVLAAAGAAILWWKLGWASAALLLVGAAISGTGLWEWMRLMTAVMARMDAGAEARPVGQSSGSEADGAGPPQPVRVRPMGQTSGSEAEVAGPPKPVQVRPMGQTSGSEADGAGPPQPVRVRPMGQSSGSEADGAGPPQPVRLRPMGRILIGFFVRLGLTLVVLYVSLKTLNGSVYALAAGLGLGVCSLTVEGLRTVKAWTV